jgi:hypothetical protein
MSPESSVFNPGLPQVFDVVGKAPIPSAVSPMAPVPQYATSTTVQPTLGGFQMPLVQAPNTKSIGKLTADAAEGPCYESTWSPVHASSWLY